MRAAGRQRDRPALRGLSRFADSRGIPASREFLLDYDVIEAFRVAGLAGRALALAVFGIGAGLRPGELVALRGSVPGVTIWHSRSRPGSSHAKAAMTARSAQSSFGRVT